MKDRMTALSPELARLTRIPSIAFGIFLPAQGGLLQKGADGPEQLPHDSGGDLGLSKSYSCCGDSQYIEVGDQLAKLCRRELFEDRSPNAIDQRCFDAATGRVCW